MTPQNVYQIKVTLKGSKPPIWRRIQVTSDISLYELHHILQVVMGWEDYHLHQFIIGGTYFGEPHPDYGFDLEMVDETTVELNQVVSGAKTKFTYEYDFGDSWEHTILIEKILPLEAGKHYPICLTGRRACPPEDCGGIWGYAYLLEAIQNPDHPEHEYLLEWVGGGFDPEAFDLDEINGELKGLSEWLNEE
jgi:hypothetical protein